MGSAQTDGGFSFAPSKDIGKEAVLEAVAKLDGDATRIREELFWVHELGGKLQIREVPTDALLQALRSEQVRNTTRGAVAAHNLAIVLTWQALSAKGTKRADYWKDALLSWKRSTDNSIFWQYMEDRAAVVSPAVDFDQPELESAVRSGVAELIIAEIQDAVREQRERDLPELLNITSTHRDWLPLDSALKRCVDDVAGALACQLGPVLDQVAGLDENTPADNIRRVLRSAEESIERISSSLQVALKPFGSWAGSEWTNLRSTGLRKLSIAYYNLLDDFDEALRIVVLARQSATDLEVIEQLDSAWKHIQESILVREAIAFMERAQFEAAEKKLHDALPLATEGQAAHIVELQESCRYGRVFRGVDRAHTSPKLHTINGIGTTFYGRRDWDDASKTYTTTQWLVCLLIPIFPIASYKVSDTGARSYRIYGRVPLSPFLSKYRWGVLAAIAFAIIAASINSSSEGSRSQYAPPATVNSPASTLPVGQDPEKETHGAATWQGSQNSSASEAEDENSAIETERVAIESLSADLERQKSWLDAEGASLDQLHARLQQVKSSYTEETVPEYIRNEYNNDVDDYNRRAPAYNRALHQYNSDVETYEQRRLAFNERVQRYNASR